MFMISDRRLLTPGFLNLVLGVYSQELHIALSVGMSQIATMVRAGEQTVVRSPTS